MYINVANMLAKHKLGLQKIGTHLNFEFLWLTLSSIYFPFKLAPFRLAKIVLTSISRFEDLYVVLLFLHCRKFLFQPLIARILVINGLLLWILCRRWSFNFFLLLTTFFCLIAFCNISSFTSLKTFREFFGKKSMWRPNSSCKIYLFS